MWKMALGERVLLRKIERGRGIVRISLKGDQRGSKDALNIAFLSLSFSFLSLLFFLQRIEFCNMLRRGCNEIREKEEGISKNCEDENLMQDDNKKLKYFKRYKWNKGWIIILFLFIYAYLKYY